LEAALREVSSLMKASMGADRCEVILKEQFGQLSQLGFATSIAQQAIDQRSAVVIQDAQSNPSLGKSAFLLRIHAAMCVPVISGDQILALIYVFKNRAYARPFDQRDLQLAVAISHQTALTIQRMQLLERVRREELVSSLLQRFLSPQEAKFVLKEYLETGQLPPLAEHTLTILAIDIADSTALAERLGARRFSKILSRYYKETTDIVFKHNGMLNKFIGDGLMAVFGLPHQPVNPELRAIETAIEMIKKVEEINSEYGEPFNVGIGINSGPTIAGYMGNLEFVEFTAIGYPVNVAWGLESQARPNRILIGHPTFEAVKSLYKLTPLENVETKPGELVQAYELVQE
jgi:adenylate cyclase